MANESVVACAEAVKTLNRQDDTLIVFHDRSDVNEFVRDGILDYCIDQNLYDQAYTAVEVLSQHLSLDQPLPSGVHHTATTIYPIKSSH